MKARKKGTKRVCKKKIDAVRVKKRQTEHKQTNSMEMVQTNKTNDCFSLGDGASKNDTEIDNVGFDSKCEMPKSNGYTKPQTNSADSLSTKQMMVVGIKSHSSADANVRILSMVLNNFKSYEGKHKIDNISRFTAIVGPNGSGKSNIIDAILFLFGYGSRKMRHKTNNDLIHNGKDNCYVEIEFCIHDNKFVLKRELVKGRTLYYADGQSVCYDEVVNKMKMCNVDLKRSRFLILQGEIENIAMMKPKDSVRGGILEYLEDIIGTSIYKKEIEDLENEVLRLKEKEDILKSSFKFQEKEYMFIKDRNTANEELLKQKVRCLKEKMKLNHIEYVHGQKNREIISEINKKLKNELTQIRNNENVGKLKRLENDLVQCKNMVAKREREFFGSKQSLDNLILEISRKEGEHEVACRAEKSALEDYENILRMQKDDEREIKILETEKEENISEIKNLENKLAKKAGEIKVLRKKCKNSIKTDELKKQIANIEKEIIILNDEKGQLKLLQIQKEDCVIRDQILELSNSLQKINRVDKNIMNDIKTLKRDLDVTVEGIQKKKDMLAETQKHHSTKRIESELISKIKGVDGFIGRLGDLGRVDKKYDIAITAASKGRLDNIVVRDVETAEKCIKIINSHKLKRTSFLILNKLSVGSFQKEKDFIYCIDLVDCEPEYKKVFAFVLKDTILCKNIKEGVDIAFNKKERHRTVSLQGDLVEKSGIMSKIRTNGTMNTHISQEKIEKELDKMQKAKEKIIALLDQKEQHIDGIKHILSQHHDVEAAAKYVEKEINRKIKLYCNITHKPKTTNLSELFADKNNELNSIDIKIANLKEKANNLHNELDLLEDSEIKQLLQEQEMLINQTNIFYRRNQDIDEKIGKLTMSETSKRLENINKSLNDARKIIKEFEKIDILRKKRDLRIKEHTAIEKLYEDEQNKIKQIYEAINGLKNYTDELIQKEMDIKNEIEQNVEKIKNMPEKIKHLDELENLKGLRDQFNDIFDKENVHNREIEQNDYSTASLEELENLMEECRSKIQKLDNDEKIDYELIHEFRKKSMEFENAKNEYCRFMTTLNAKIAEFSKKKSKRHDEFMTKLSIINEYLKDTYKKITQGGNAELELVDYTDPFSEGITLSVMPPKKTWNKISALSGGEKTLASLALVFALHRFNPSPFYIMDEIDAALDFRNVGLIANLIKEQQGQFLVISLRNDMFELADRLIGVYKNNGKSNVIALDSSTIEI